MSAPRFFVEGTHRSGELVALAGSDAHKVRHVLRMRTGDGIEIVDSGARRFAAELRIEADRVDAVLLEDQANDDADLPEITLAQGIPKGQKMDFVVEKATELGVARIIPLVTERAIAHASPAKLERWRRLARSAAQQCGRATLPEIAAPDTLAHLCATFAQYDAVLFPWELAQPRPLQEMLAPAVKGAARLLIVVGPEGGFAHAEAMAAQDAGARLLHLGSRILRTETAALALLSIIGYLCEA